MLTRKHFRAIASIVSCITDDAQRKLARDRFSIYLRGENSSFNDSLFREACDPPPPPTTAKSGESPDWLSKD